MKKVFYLFAGVNGAGKSTLYNLAIINKNISFLLCVSYKTSKNSMS